MAGLIFEDHSNEVMETLNDAIIAFLYEAAGELQAQTMRNTPVDTGQLKGSWEYAVDEEKQVARIGSPLENAIWNELGTGIHAETTDGAPSGNGRRNPWSYQDVRGVWHHTNGKKANHSLQRAYISKKGSIVRRAEEILKARMR